MNNSLRHAQSSNVQLPDVQLPDVQSLGAKSIFLAAIEKSPGDRSAFLEQACAGDRDLLAQVQKLLRSHEALGTYHEPAAADRALFGEHAAIGPETCDASPSERIGKLVGPYKLLEQIGEGGMGLVYMAEQQRPLKRLVALKIIKPGMDTRQVIARFEAERQALALMDHPNIARILDAGTVGEPGAQIGEPGASAPGETPPAHAGGSPGRPYFVMELVRGIPITEFCDQKRLTVRQRLELFIQVCQAVQHAHQKGIIHRDLKPTNVLVTMHDTQPVPKVIDFGIAKALGQSLTDHTLHTGFAQLVGTPLYMSPEQAEMNALGVDTRSDVYSLGVMLYELLTGTTPFDKERLTKVGFDEMRRIIREEEPETVSTRIARTLATKPGASTGAKFSRRVHAALPELDWIVAKSLEKDRARRYESASAMAADVQRYLNGELVHACPPSAIYRFRKFARKHKASFATTVVVAASLLLGATVSAWQAIRATAAEAQANANEAEANKAAAGERQQRKRAEASEREAKQRLEEVERQRQQALKNFEAALDAVDRMLANVTDPDVQNLPRFRPVRRKMLNDAIAFYDRIPIQFGLSAEYRFRTARARQAIGRLCRNIGDDYRQSLRAFELANEAYRTMATDFPEDDKYKLALAECLELTASLYESQMKDAKSGQPFRREVSEIFAALAKQHPTDKSWLIRYAQSLTQLTWGLDNREEQRALYSRVFELLEANGASEFENADALYHFARWTHWGPNPEEADPLFDRAIAVLRKHANSDQATPVERANFAHTLYTAAVRGDYWRRHPEQAEALLDESIARHRAEELRTNTGYPNLILALAALANNLRRHASLLTSRDDDERVAAMIKKADILSSESIERQHRAVVHTSSDADHAYLMTLLHNEAAYILSRLAKMAAQSAPSDAISVTTALKLRADTYLTEAIQLCRALAGEYPANAEYTNRLSALLKLQAQHFGQLREAERSDQTRRPDQAK